MSRIKKEASKAENLIGIGGVGMIICFLISIPFLTSGLNYIDYTFLMWSDDAFYNRKVALGPTLFLLSSTVFLYGIARLYFLKKSIKK